MNMARAARRWRATVAVAVGVIAISGCGGGSGDYESPIINEDVPVMDIADLPDIDETRAQMLDLIERVRAEVTRLVPATAPWTWNRDESTGGCTQEKTGRKGVSLTFANLHSPKPFNDAEWDLVYPAVQRLAAEAGLTSNSAMQNSSGNHDVRFNSDDGRTLVFGSWKASVITGRIACRRAADTAPAPPALPPTPPPGATTTPKGTGS